MAHTDMLKQEREAFLDQLRFASVGGKTPDGGAAIRPAMFMRDGSDVIYALEDDQALAAQRMDEAAITDFLQNARYPIAESPPLFIAISTLRKNEKPIIVPFGYYWDGKHIYLTINNVRTLHARLRRDNRLAVGIYNTELPMQAVVINGRAEAFEDPGNAVSRQIFTKHMGDYSFLDFESYLEKWLGAGRTTYRVSVDQIFGWNDATPPASGGSNPLPPIGDVEFATVFNEQFPTMVVLMEGRSERLEDDGTLSARLLDRYRASAEAQSAAWATRPRTFYRLKVSRVQTWDTNKQPEERVRAGKEEDGRHVERGDWITIGDEAA